VQDKRIKIFFWAHPAHAPDRAFRLYLFACGKKDTASIPCAFSMTGFFFKCVSRKQAEGGVAAGILCVYPA
jgi:hypothetical protein